MRFGEWISEPVTPLFESWLLSRMEERLHARLEELIGQRAPRPYHVVVNGWYFYSLNVFGRGAWLRNLPRMVAKGVRSPRNVAGIIPLTVRHSIPAAEREWREVSGPRYRAAVADAEARLDSLPVEAMPPLIDELSDLSGEYFTSIAALGGAAYRMEMNLARFYRRHLRPSLGGSHLPLLAGFEPPGEPDAHAVVSLDWWFEPAGPWTGPADQNLRHQEVVAAREAAEAAAFAALVRSPRRLASFQSLLAETQRLVPLREQQARELTLAWPVMRRMLDRIGARLADAGLIPASDAIYFMTRGEALDGLAKGVVSGPIDVAARRALRESQAVLRPPLTIGRMGPVMRRLFEAFPRLLGATVSADAIVSGVPASPGRVTGRVRVILGPGQFDQLESGEILVSPLTAPAWTPLFSRAAAVVTDIGSAASHASIIAREYGIPAIVGCADATARLRTGMRVIVDGATGNVEPAEALTGSVGSPAEPG